MTAKIVRTGTVLLVLMLLQMFFPIAVHATTPSVSAVPSVQTVAPGGTFDLNIRISTDVETRSFQFTVAWDPSLIECLTTPVPEEGPFYASFVTAHANDGIDQMIMPGNASANNTTGRFPSTGALTIALQGSLMGTADPYPGPTGTGNAFILHMKAKTGTSGTAAFTLSNVGLGDNAGTTNPLNPTVNNGNMTISNAATQVPTVSDFTPKTGGSGTTVTITGTNFSNLQFVKFGGTQAQSITPNANGTQITAVVGSGATGKVTVANTGGTVDSTDNFTYIPTPDITAFSPTTNGINKNVTIIGTNLSGATSVKFGGIAATIISNTATQIVAKVGTGTSGDVSVTTGGGTATMSGFTFAPLPTISSFSPTSGSTGTTITITGTNFVNGGNSVTIGGVEAGVTSNTATQIVATVGSGASSGSVVVTTAGGSATSSGFTYQVQSPTIASFTPTSGGAGASVIITGTNFNGTTAVSFGNTPAQSFIINSSNQISVVVGNGASGSVSVVTPGGTATLAGFSFTTSSTPTPTPTASATPTSTPTTAPTTTPVQTQSPTSTRTLRPTNIAAPTTSVSGVSAQSSLKTTAPANTGSIVQNSATGNSFDLTRYVDTSGMLISNYEGGGIRYSGNNVIVSVNVPKGTRMVASDGSPVTKLTMKAATNVPAAENQQTLVSAIEMGPSGTTFSTPINVVLGYDPTQVPERSGAGNISLQYYNSETKKWIPCDYTVDDVNHQIKANVSHFSLYAVMVSGTSSLMGMGWSMAAMIILGEVLIGIIIMYYFLRRRRPLAPAEAVISSEPAIQNNANQGEHHRDTSYSSSSKSFAPGNAEISRAIWDDILPGAIKKGEPFKTHLEIIGGKIVIPRDGKSADIELINSPDSRILISLEYDPETRPQGLAKIMVLGPALEYEKSKEIKK